MYRFCLVAVFCGLWPAIATSETNPPCSIQRVTAVGSYVWMLCDQKGLLVSPDEGVTWQTRQVPSSVKLRRGFVVGDGGTLLATEDGAATWRQVPLPTQENLRSIHFVGELGWIAGWNGVIFHSSDGGKTWNRQESGAQQGLDCIFFADADHGWAVGWAGTIVRTTNGGRTWEGVRAASGFWSLSSVYFRDASQGWAVGFRGQVLRSNDGGVTWEQQTIPVQSSLTSVVIDASGRGWITGSNHLLTSEDGGATWRSVAIDGTPFLHQVLPVKDTLWAIGQSRVLRRAGDGQVFSALTTLPGADPKGGQS
jgi:photosystem II stability/assembly factor-like uncharacterized protein